MIIVSSATSNYLNQIKQFDRTLNHRSFRYLTKSVLKIRNDIQKKYRSNHQRCSIKKLFLKISQYLQENGCVGVSFQYKFQLLQYNFQLPRDYFWSLFLTLGKGDNVQKMFHDHPQLYSTSVMLHYVWRIMKIENTQLAFTCSKSTIEALEKGVKYIQINNKHTRTMSLTSFWCFNC